MFKSGYQLLARVFTAVLQLQSYKVISLVAIKVLMGVGGWDAAKLLLVGHLVLPQQEAKTPSFQLCTERLAYILHNHVQCSTRKDHKSTFIKE
jgi:hypothetical protein